MFPVLGIVTILFICVAYLKYLYYNRFIRGYSRKITNTWANPQNRRCFIVYRSYEHLRFLLYSRKIEVNKGITFMIVRGNNIGYLYIDKPTKWS